jgi:hypothetical protein
MPPREYASRIAAGEIILDSVPAYLHDLVTSLLHERDAVIWSRANVIAQLPALADRRWQLSQVDPSIREEVKQQIAIIWQEKHNGD